MQRIYGSAGPNSNSNLSPQTQPGSNDDAMLRNEPDVQDPDAWPDINPFTGKW